MKTLLLEDILHAMGIKPNKFQNGVSIVNVTRELYEADHNTVYFRVKKGWKLDGEKLKNYHHFYIVTDAPFLNMEKLRPEQVIMVDNLMKAFLNFTSYYRHMFNIPVVAITGTSGKTTTKEMLKHILQKDLTVQATISNKNAGCYHLPYLLGIDEKTDVAVIEMAVSRRGDMMEACEYFFPTIGLMTMIDVDHTDKIRLFENYKAEKAKLMEGLGNKGTLIINLDDEHISSMDFTKYLGKIVTYGKSKTADLRIKRINFQQNNMKYILAYKGQQYKGKIPVLGEHNVYNAIASIAAAIEIGADIEKSINRLATFSQLESHFQIIKGRNQITIIDDTWKSNSASLNSGLLTLDKLSIPFQRKIAVLGRIAALGEYADEEYEKVGYLVEKLGIDKLITKGSLAKDIGKAAVAAGMNKQDVYHFSDPQDIKNLFDELLQPGDIVYFKTGGNDEAFEDFIRFLK
ncbi:hypothetical protein ELQ35_01185 [Peribacillus cavernae]|uniref:UDP-N-acetylmuramoyl-tripeptide--D-alanyl-D-alanine ligase n=1 Tax=Peribacillus cavernae TaxID=1674310 RepID=A0A3S1BCC3_9BACI|nr:Mur ligase family protein [Peribacillus cavernae]MDQ0218113.1 UDP-N-acetylmuramoyl-tripeptide--D-alanyl-D-alanine ligase [Peribacillus cavernae]RUQ32731.1 hypothetical protein ELQ35_01185 [Peribacillus cavernae]